MASEGFDLGHFNLEMGNNCIVLEAVFQNYLVCVQEHISEMLSKTEQRLSCGAGGEKKEKSFHMQTQNSI